MCNNVDLDWIAPTVIQWLDPICPIFARLDEDSFCHASLSAMGELIKHGCTAAFDHQYDFSRASGKRIVGRQFGVAALLGMRFRAGRGCSTLPKSEGRTIPDALLETADGFLADCERLIGAYHDPSEFSMRGLVLAPCQPVNCYAETFTEAVRLARDKGVFLHSHVGEGESEARRRCSRWCSRTPG